MGVAEVGEGVDIEVACRVDGGVEHEAYITVPVAIDILGLGDAAAILHTRGLIADGIARGVEVDEGHHSALVLLEVVVVEEVEVLTERGLQTRVTFLDVQGVAVVGDVEQVAHLRLLGVGAVGEAQLARGRLLPAEVHGRSEVGDGTRGVGVDAQIVLSEVRLLGYHLHTDVEGVSIAYDAQHHLSGMDVVLVFGESALVEILIGIEVGDTEMAEIAVPRTVIGIPGIELGQAAEVVGAAVALLVTILVLVTELEVGSGEDGLAVGEAGAVVPVLGGGDGVAVDGVASDDARLEVVDVAVADGAALAVAPACIQLDGDVAAIIAETAVELQHTVQILRVAVGDALLVAVVQDDALADERGHLVEGGLHVVVGVLAEGGLIVGVVAIVGVIAECGAEEDVGHRVGLPLEAHLGVPVVGAREVVRHIITIL